MALTATATHHVRDDVLRSLAMRAPARFTVSFFRDNLTFRVCPKDYAPDKESGLQAWQARLLQYVAARPRDTGIVYCLSRDDTEETARLLRDAGGVPAAHYHAGLTPKQRTQVQNAWRRGEVAVVCATIAFGMVSARGRGAGRHAGR
jgi:bloom syndrome protein